MQGQSSAIGRTIDAGTLIDAATRNRYTRDQQHRSYIFTHGLVMIRHLIVCRVSWCLIGRSMFGRWPEKHND